MALQWSHIRLSEKGGAPSRQETAHEAVLDSEKTLDRQLGVVQIYMPELEDVVNEVLSARQELVRIGNEEDESADVDAASNNLEGAINNVIAEARGTVAPPPS